MRSEPVRRDASNSGANPSAVLASLAAGVLGTAYHAEIPARMLEMIGRAASQDDRRLLLRALRALHTRAGAAALTGRPVPVPALSPRKAEALLRRWQSSRIPARRRLARAVVALSVAELYGHPGPHWDRIGYPGPLGAAPSAPARLQPLQITRDERMSCDAVVVGSGAGGGCAAAVLAAAGLDVVVLERGGYHGEASFDHHEARAYRSMYLYALTLSDGDQTCRILAGSALGGGTVVNYSTCLRPPGPVLREWTRLSGVEAFASGEFEESLDEVSARLGVTTECSTPGRRDALMELGLRRLGWHVGVVPRAVRGCPQDAGCGYCGFGCRVGAKQSASRTYLEDAAAHGARIVTGANALRVVIDDRRAAGVSARCGTACLDVDARAVIVGCGAIETPALLLRSRLSGRIGFGLRLHPGTAAWGVFDDEVRPWEGTLQARYSEELRGWDGGYGPMLETVPVHPGAAAAAVPWTSAGDHARRMAGLAHLSLCAVLPRDRSAGRVRIGRDGNPRISYRIGRDDQRRIAKGLVAAGRVMEAAGARQVSSPHRRPITFRPGGYDRWAAEVRAAGARPGDVTFFSFHQMGSCPMGVDPSRSVVGPDNQSHEVRGLYVVDGSVFPTASGVNPMLTIYAIANRCAKQIATRLR